MSTNADIADRIESKITNVSVASLIVRILRESESPDQRAETKLIYLDDGDKLRQHPAVNLILMQTLGCRLHGTVGCRKWLCKELLKDALRMVSG